MHTGWLMHTAWVLAADHRRYWELVLFELILESVRLLECWRDPQALHVSA